MPRVPQYQPGQVAPVQTTSARLRAPDNAGGLGMLAQGLAGVAQLAETQDKINFANEETQTRKIKSEFLNAASARTDEYKALKMGAARSGQEAFNADLDKLKSTYLDQATTPRMRQMVDAALMDIDGSARRMAASHALSESRAETKASFGAEQSSLIDSAVASDDPAYRDQLSLTLRDSVRAQLEFEGIDEEATPQVYAVAEKAAMSKLHSGVLDRMFASPDPDMTAISEYRAAYGDEMTSDLRNNILKRLQGPMQDRMARADADHYMGLAVPDAGAGTGEPGAAGADRLNAITVQSESGGDPNAVSPKGARGLMQVMPGTARDPGFGIRPSAGTPADDVRVGREYRAKMEDRYGGDLAKMWAAYNWGPGNVDKAIEKYGSNWLDHAPAETKNYVRKNIAALGESGGAYTPVPREWSADAKQAAYAAIERDIDTGVISPERGARAKQMIDSRFRTDEGLLRERYDQADQDASDFVARLGDGFTSIDQLPRSVRDAMSSTSLMQWGRVADANKRATAPSANGDIAIAVAKMAITDPAQFAATDLSKYRPLMTPGEYAQFEKDQARARRPDNAATDVRPKVDAEISRQKKWGGYDIDEDPDEGLRVRRYMEAKADEMRASKKEPTAQDYTRWYTEATQVIATTKRFIGIPYGSGELRSSTVLSPAYRRMIRDGFRRTNGREPTEAEIQEWFTRMGEGLAD